MKPCGTSRRSSRNDARYFRGTGGYHLSLGLHGGAQPAVVRIVFDVADRPRSTPCIGGRGGGGKRPRPAN